MKIATPTRRSKSRSKWRCQVLLRDWDCKLVGREGASKCQELPQAPRQVVQGRSWSHRPLVLLPALQDSTPVMLGRPVPVDRRPRAMLRGLQAMCKIIIKISYSNKSTNKTTLQLVRTQ